MAIFTLVLPYKDGNIGEYEIPIITYLFLIWRHYSKFDIAIKPINRSIDQVCHVKD